MHLSYQLLTVGLITVLLAYVPRIPALDDLAASVTKGFLLAFGVVMTVVSITGVALSLVHFALPF